MPDVVPTAAAARRPSLIGFFVTAFAVSWLGGVPMVVASYLGAAAIPGPLKAIQLLMLFGPGLVAVAWAAREGGWAGVRALLAGLGRWRVHPAWWAALLLGPLALFVLALAASRALAITAVAVPPAGRILAAFVPSFVGYLLLNTEEIAWRGYAWPRLAERFGRLRASLVLGAIWTLFHLPLFLLRGGHPGGYPPALFVAMVLVYSVLFSLAYEGTGRSLLLVHLFHQALNAWGDSIPLYPRLTGSILPAALGIAVAGVIAIYGVTRAGWWREEGDAAIAPVSGVAA